MIQLEKNSTMNNLEPVDTKFQRSCSKPRYLYSGLQSESSRSMIFSCFFNTLVEERV